MLRSMSVDLGHLLLWRLRRLLFVADVTLVLAIFSDFRFNSHLSLLHNVGDQAIRSSSRIVIMLDRRLLLVWCMYLICVPNLRT